MKIHLPAYRKGTHHIHETANPQELDLDPEVFLSGIVADFDLDRNDPNLRFQFDLTTQVHLVCDRCLAEYETELEATGPMVYIMGSPRDGDEVDDPEIRYVPMNTTDLDVSVEVRDLLMLSLPFRRLCSPDCKGLCPECGADLNTNPCGCGRSVIEQN